MDNEHTWDAVKESHFGLLDPYRTLGNFVSGKLSLSVTEPLSFTAPTACSFKVYSETLGIKVASPPFPSLITAAISFNELSYIRTGSLVVKLKYHHILKQWSVGPGNSLAPQPTFLLFEQALLLAEGSTLFVILNQVESISMAQNILGMIHPVTYINKVLIYHAKGAKLINAQSKTILYEYPNLKKYLEEGTISCLTAATLVDIVMIGVSTGELLCYNIKKDSLVFTMRQKKAALAIGICSDRPLMATSDCQGNVLLWNLKEKKILYKYEIGVQVDSLFFVYPLLTCGSSLSNCLHQLRVNHEDSRLLTLFRERIGMSEQLQSCTMGNSNEIVLSSSKESMFVSFHSQCNNYKLPRSLDSKLPTHLLSQHFNVLVYNEKTLAKTFNIHEQALLGKISLSRRYFVVATKSRVIKLGGIHELVYHLSHVTQLALFNQHYIYAFTKAQMLVCDFNTELILSTTNVSNPINVVTNAFVTMLALQSDLSIQVWDMQKVTLGRKFPILSTTNCLAFTSENRYLVSAHLDNTLCIYDIFHGSHVKTYRLQTEIISLAFTPDSQFLITIFKGHKQANIWSNYIGKVTSNRTQQYLPFQAAIRFLAADYRLELQKAQKSSEAVEYDIDILDCIPDVEDGVPQYDFSEVTKWLPLVYYDEIKARHTPQMAPTYLPFFLDFRNIEEEKEKITKQLLEEAKEKKRKHNKEQDRLLQDKNHAIVLTDLSRSECTLQFQSLRTLSVAEVDFQLRTFLLNLQNGGKLIQMMRSLIEMKQSMQIVNVLTVRVLLLLGSDIFAVKQQAEGLLSECECSTDEQRRSVDKCIAIVERQ